MSEKEPKYKKVVEGAEQLSLGVSIVVAILLGLGIGMLMKSALGYDWLLWVGVFWGVGAAGLNIYKAYKKQMKSLNELKDDVRYEKYKDQDDDDDE